MGRQFGGVDALSGPQPDDQGGRVHRPARAVGLRQVDGAELPGRPAPAHARRRSCIDGRRIDTLPPEQRGFGMVFQTYALFPHLSVEKNVAFGLQMQGLPRAEIESAGRRGDRARQARRARQEAARPALGRAAAARRHRARGGARTVARAHGRAAVEPGREAAARHAHRDPAAAPVARAHHDLRDARPGGGAVPGRPPGRAARRPRPAGRHARRAPREPGELARSGLHGVPEPPATVVSTSTATRR